MIPQIPYYLIIGFVVIQFVSYLKKIKFFTSQSILLKKQKFMMFTYMMNALLFTKFNGFGNTHTLAYKEFKK